MAINVSDADLDKMLSECANGVTYNISWPTRPELAIALRRCRKRASANNARLKLQIAELERKLQQAKEAADGQ